MLSPINISSIDNSFQVNLQLLPYSMSERLNVDTKVCMLMQHLNDKYIDVKVQVIEDLYHLITGVEVIFSSIEDMVEFKLSRDLLDIFS